MSSAVNAVATVERHYTRRSDFTRWWRYYSRRGRRVLAYVSGGDDGGWTLVIDAAKVTP